jgi:iron complex transport system substrate-binding protein
LDGPGFLFVIDEGFQGCWEVYNVEIDREMRDHEGSEAIFSRKRVTAIAGKYAVLFVFTCLAVMVTYCARAATEPPQRIVSCGPAVTEKLYLLGMERNIVGVTVYCRRPPEAERKPKIGSVTQINVEKVVSLRPDLVCATSLTDPRSVNKLKALGIRVALFREPKSFAEMNEQFIEMGRLTGRERVAREIVRMAEKKVERIRAGTKGLPRPKVFLQIGANPLFTASKESFLNDFVEFSGGINIAGHSTGGLYNREQVLAEDPDIILIVAMEGPTAEREKKRWERFGTIKAVRGHAVYVIDPYKMCSPTPVTFVEALETLVNLVHPRQGTGGNR